MLPKFYYLLLKRAIFRLVTEDHDVSLSKGISVRFGTRITALSRASASKQATFLAVETTRESLVWLMFAEVSNVGAVSIIRVNVSLCALEVSASNFVWGTDILTEICRG